MLVLRRWLCHELHDQGKMSWSLNATHFGAPVSVVWRTVFDNDGKPEQKARPMVDIRGLNKISTKDSYPLPLQQDLIAKLQGCTRIGVVDAVSFFYQWLVHRGHRERLAVNT